MGDRDVKTEKWSDDVYFLNFFKVNVNTGDTDIVFHGTAETVQFVTDGRGHILGRIDQTSDLVDHFYIGPREVASYDVKDGDILSIWGVAPDGGSLAATTYGDNDTLGLYAYQFGAAKTGAPLFFDHNYDLAGLTMDEWSGRVGGVSWIDDKTEYKYFDSAVEHVRERIARVLVGQSVAVISHDKTDANYVIEAQGPKSPTTFYLFNAPTGQLSIVGSSYPSLTAADLGDVRPYTYKSTDGTDIHAYLTLPPGKTMKDLPTVIFPHGGPALRDKIGFDWWAQFMASRGYAVLQPNFRGSDGYGVKFRDLGDGQWNGKVLDDVSAGVRQLIRDGVANPKRICIVGASFGGYLALAGATFTPDLYACAVSYAGVSDLKRDLDRTAQYYGKRSQALSIWEKRMGASLFDNDKLAAQSPVAHADQVRAPVLLIHSSKDITVFPEQSDEEEAALKGAGKNSQLVVLEGDDHNLLQSATRIQMLKALEILSRRAHWHVTRSVSLIPPAGPCPFRWRRGSGCGSPPIRNRQASTRLQNCRRSDACRRRWQWSGPSDIRSHRPSETPRDWRVRSFRRRGPWDWYQRSRRDWRLAGSVFPTRPWSGRVPAQSR